VPSPSSLHPDLLPEGRRNEEDSGEEEERLCQETDETFMPAGKRQAHKRMVNPPAPPLFKGGTHPLLQ